MRKTRSRYNHPPINLVDDNKEKDKLDFIPPVRKRGRRNHQNEEQASTILTTDVKNTNSTNEINENNEINEETTLSSKKSFKSSTKRLYTRKSSGNSKKEFSKSNFCMNKILQNTHNKSEEPQKDNLLSDNEPRNGYSIQISEECFHHWKRTKEELNFRDDEDLIYHLMNLKRRTLSVTLESISTEHQTTNGHEALPEQNSICNESSNNNSEDAKENIKSSRTRKNDTQSSISKSEVGCKDNADTNLEHKQNENQEAVREKTNLKRRKNRRYDSRKTPSDGIPDSKNKRSPLSPKDTSNEQQDEHAEDIINHSNNLKTHDITSENAESPPSRPNSGLGYPINDENWCYNCDFKHETKKDCPYEDPASICIDSVIDFSANDRDDISSYGEGNEKEGSDGYNNYSRMDLSKSFAQLSLPHPLILQEQGGKKALGVIAKTSIDSLTQFGPLQGEQILLKDIADDFEMKELWQIIMSNGTRKYISTSNPEKSNWVRYIRPAPARKQRNVAAVYKDDQLFFITCRNISKGEEILYWMDDPDLLWTKKKCEKKNCGGCNLKFVHPLYYRLHCNVFHDPHYSLTIRKYHCKICGLAVLGKENIVKHASTEHDGRGAYQCQYCKKFFLRLNYLEMHRTYGCSENPGRTRPLCDLCGKKFCQPQKLKVHMRRMHSGKPEATQEFQCQICEKVLGTRHAALRHRKEVHSDIPIKANGEVGPPPSRVDCPKCDRTFKNKSNLKIHMLTHSGVKPFGCKVPECKTRFTTKQCLQFHYRKTHNLTDENMPSIEREIPYTLSAYSGGIADEVKSSTHKRSSGGSIQHSEKISRPGKSRDVYDFKESDEDLMSKRRQMLEKDEMDIRRSLTSDPDEGKSESDLNLDDKEKNIADDDNRNGSSVDADDESDERMPCTRRVYKSRFASRQSTSEPERINQDRPIDLFENSVDCSKTRKVASGNPRSKFAPSTRTRSSTRSKTAKLQIDSKENDSSNVSQPVPDGHNTTSIDANKTHVSASSLVLAALSAAEQDLGSHVLPMEQKVSSSLLNETSYLEKRSLSIDDEKPVTISAYSEAQKHDHEVAEGHDFDKKDEGNQVVADSSNAVTITAHRESKDSPVGIQNCEPEGNNFESRSTNSPNPEDYTTDTLYSSTNKISNSYEHIRKPEPINSVEIIPVPRPNDMGPVNGATYEDYPKRDTLEPATYSKDEMNVASVYHGNEMKSPLPRQPTPSAPINEGITQHHINSRSPSSLPPPPSTPHFPANAYPHHFPSPDLTQFSNQLYHSGLDSLARTCYPPFRTHSNSNPADYSTFPRSSSHSVDFMSQSIPASNHEGSYNGPMNGMSNFSNANGVPPGISNTPSPSSLDLSQASSSSAAAIAAAAVAEMLPPPGNPRSPFGSNSSPSHLSPFYPPPHCNMINDHLLNVASGPKDLSSSRVPSTNMHNVPDASATRQGSNPYIHQNYSLYESSRFPANASSVGYPAPTTPPNGHNRLPHISPGASPYHHYGYFQ